MFSIYCIGMLIALGLNVTRSRPFALRLFYASIIVYAHFMFFPDGRHFYAECGIAQYLILIAAIAIRCEAAMPIAGMALVAVIANFLGYINYPSHGGIWPYYYALINTVQVFQILCLITVSPITLPWIRKFLTTKTGRQTWMLRLVVG